MKPVCTILFALFFSYSNLLAQEPTVDVTELIRDLQIWKKDNKNMKMVWWIPTKYWEISTRGNSSVSSDVLKEIEEIVDGYSLFATLDMDISSFGMDYNDSTVIKLVDANGKEYFPLTEDEMPEKLGNMIAMLTPTLARMIGPIGENMQFHVFLNQDEQKKDLLIPDEKGNFSVKMNGESFDWRLPLGSLVPHKTCPVDNEHLKGSWMYCPHHGSKLK